ncbi:hypothetical protein J0H58_07040 [bacterium]|nr:hypothetical protein [bacterium]
MADAHPPDAGASSAEDVTQEVFLRAYRTLGALRVADRIAPWLVGIARRVVQEVRRRPPPSRPSSPAGERPPATRPTTGTRSPTCSRWWPGSRRTSSGPSGSSSWPAGTRRKRPDSSTGPGPGRTP